MTEERNRRWAQINADRGEGHTERRRAEVGIGPQIDAEGHR